VGLVLADVSVGHPAPGLGGRHLVLLIGMVFATLAWLAWLPPDRVDVRVILAVLVAGVVGGGLAGVVSPHTSALLLPTVIAMLAGSSLPPLEAAGVAACGLITLGAGSLVITTSGFSFLGACLAVVGGLLVGLWRRQFRLRAEQAELLAVQTQRAEAEHIRAQVLDERTRIAREIHDILAHTLGGLVIQLDAADAILGDGRDIDRGRDLVEEARRLAGEGLQETRRAVAALRTDPVAVPEALAELAGGNGHVHHQVDGSPRPLSPNASLAIYRTAQEALTNARKHAPEAPVTMKLSFEKEAAVLRVTNPTLSGPAAGERSRLAATGGGYGLSGLKERAELAGGTLHAGPSEEGWVVEVRVPA
jgi:signal transduction histidine kinase